MEQRYNLFTNLIADISRNIQKIKNAEMSVYGLKGKQVQCLFALYNSKGGASLTGLCEMCAADKGAMSRTVKELAESGLVYTDGNSAQKYKNPVKLTEKGEAFGNVVAEKISDVICSAGAGISDGEREILYKTLMRISDNLSDVLKERGVKND